ncbi:MAG: S-layer homology domain-containing protein [Oscillibacter sp.]|nr:S-layer homology domain-containing protein [Oscillibacter sp.]
MSLSLMATAGAADFKDASSINDKYETAVEVLEGLGVFRGYEDGSFQPTGSITRAETAAIIYRIVTGDVEDKQVGIYADYNLFTDVPATAWYAGYVNYCANAEYIKGVGNNKFNPNAQVTGYAALAMILRAIGYTANGGFTGTGWEVQTARTGEARKITKNILTGTLGQPATRETVAEILFQAILVNMVGHNVLFTQDGEQGYYELTETLGHKTFGLEQIEGVVMANEYANLNGSRVIGKDKTDLQVAGETTTRRLDIGTEITDIGESRYAYVTSSKVLAMGDTGKNKVTETGKAVDISTASKFSAVAEMSNTNTQYFLNFEPNNAGNYRCDQRLEFSVVFYGEDAEKAFDNYRSINISQIAGTDSEWSVEVNTGTATDPAFTPAQLKAGETDYVAGNTIVAYEYPVRYTKIIWADRDITETDLLVLESIFGTADNANNNVLLNKRIAGDVFVGTKSTNNEVTDEERDLSNSISYKKFYEEYILSNEKNYNWTVTWNGWWTKFVDNNGDGAAEYAFTTNYELEEALYDYTDRDGNTYIEYNDFDDENDKVKYLNDYTPAIGDKVLAAYIDGQWLVEPAQSENVTVTAYSWRNDEITTDKDTYGQSGIINATNMLELISTMDDKVEYVVYFDHFGYVRAYELPGGTQYALVTEMYYTNGQHGNLVESWPMTAELATLDENGETVIKEYNVVSGASTFTAAQPWLYVDNVVTTNNMFTNWLQPAIAHLGVTRKGYEANKGTPTWATPAAYSTFWNTNRQLVRNIAALGMTNVDEFNYGVQKYEALFKNANKVDVDWDVNATSSFTNVAIVGINGDDASLSGAASLRLDKDAQLVGNPGDAFAYATDYVQLAVSDIAAKAVRYPIAGDPQYIADNNTYVNAVHDTLYFIAYNGGVYAFKDYANFPGLTVDDNQIHAAYAVVHNTRDITDSDNAPYWVADVIVYEIYADVDSLAQTSVALAFYTPTRISGNVQSVETLNSKYGPEVTLIPKDLAWSADRGQWGAQWDGYGFYALFNDTEPVDNTMEAREISRIGARDGNTTDFVRDYTKNGIHAGIIYREAYIDGAGEYIDVDLGDGRIASIEITNKIYSITNDRAQSDNWYAYNEATLLRNRTLANSDIRKGDSVIWVGGAKTDRTRNTTSFVVDLGNDDNNKDLLAATVKTGFLIDVDANGKVVDYKTATYASGEWQKIMREQYDSLYSDWSVKVTKYVDANGNEITAADGKLPVFVSPETIQKGKADGPYALTFNETGADYKVTAVTVTSTNSKGENTALVTVNPANGSWQIANVTSNVTLTVVVAPVVPAAPDMVDVELNLNGANNVQLDCGNDTVLTGNGAKTTVAEGTELTLKVTPDTAHGYVNYEVKVNGVAIERDSIERAAGDYVYVIKAEKDLDIVVTALTGNVTLVNNTTATVSAKINDATVTLGATNVLPTGKLEFTLAPAATNYEVKNGTTTVNPVDGKYTVDVEVGKAVNLTINALKYAVTLDTTGVTGTVALKNGAATVASGSEVPAGTELTLTITPAANCTYEVKVNSSKINPDETNGNVYTITVNAKTDIVVTEVKHDMPVADTTTKPGTTIYKLTTDVKLNTQLQIDGKTEIDLNGNDIEFSADVDRGIKLDGNDNLTIKGEGTIKVTKDEGIVEVIRVNGNNNILTIGEDVTLVAPGSSEDEEDYGYGIIIGAPVSGTVVNMNGTITGACGLYVHGNNHTSAGTININGKIGAEDLGLYLAGVATTNINEGAEIYAGNAGIEIRNGDLNMVGGSVNGDLEDPTHFRPTPSGGGSTGFSAGIVASSYGLGTINVKIFAGEVNGTSQLALKGVNPGTAANAQTSMNIEYSVSVITTSPMFGDGNSQYTYWAIGEVNALGMLPMAWRGTPTAAPSDFEVPEAPEAVEDFEVLA